MLLDAWFAPPVAMRRNDGTPSREDTAGSGPAALRPAISYRPSIRVPRFVWGLLPHRIGSPQRG